LDTEIIIIGKLPLEFQIQLINIIFNTTQFFNNDGNIHYYL